MADDIITLSLFGGAVVRPVNRPRQPSSSTNTEPEIWLRIGAAIAGAGRHVQPPVKTEYLELTGH